MVSADFERRPAVPRVSLRSAWATRRLSFDFRVIVRPSSGSPVTRFVPGDSRGSLEGERRTGGYLFFTSTWIGWRQPNAAQRVRGRSKWNIAAMTRHKMTRERARVKWDERRPLG
jgi:hypothetical protein